MIPALYEIFEVKGNGWGAEHGWNFYSMEIKVFLNLKGEELGKK